MADGDSYPLSVGFKNENDAKTFKKNVIKAVKAMKGTNNLKYINISYNGIIGKYIVNWQV